MFDKSRFSGVLVVDKPKGPTSHDVVFQARRLLGAKVGHTGTLDPLASGVLPLVLGNATRLARFFQSSEKVYEAVVRLGVATDTYDCEGRVTETHEVGASAICNLESLLASFEGTISQRPPIYSAIKVRGERLYKSARRGEEVEVPLRTVEIHSLQLLAKKEGELVLRVHCSAGTYIRSLAHDIGQQLGVGAHLSDLRRLRSGAFSLEDAVSFDDLDESLGDGLIPMEALLEEWPKIELSTEPARRIRNGLGLEFSEDWSLPSGFSSIEELNELGADEFLRLFCKGHLIGLGEVREDSLRPKMIFSTG